MKRKFVVFLTIAAFIVALSLIIIQVGQMRQTVSISNNLFNISVGNAMEEVVDRLNSLKVEDYLSSTYRYKLLQFKRLEEINDRMRTLLRDHSALFYDEERVSFGVSLQDSAIIRRGHRLSQSDSAAINEYNTLIDSRNHILSGNMQSVHYEQHPENILDELMLAETFNYPQLDSLIYETLLLHGIELHPYVAVTSSAAGDMLYISDSSRIDDLQRTPYKYSFHPNLSSNVYYISLYFSSRSPLLRENMQFYTITSVILIAILLVMFALLVRSIVNQNKTDEMKSDFIANMTHEIKTPISTISLVCQMLEDKTMQQDPAALAKYITIIGDENRRMRMLVETILQSAKMSNKRFNLNRSQFDLKPVVDNITKSFNTAIASRKGQLTIVNNASSTIVNADELHITNAIYNLVDNAIKYSPDELWVELTLHDGDNSLLISVADHGLGISRDDQRHIFEKFYRVPTGNIHNVKGFGIGLDYVRQVALRHGGTITVNSEPGQGSTFTLSLPK